MNRYRLGAWLLPILIIIAFAKQLYAIGAIGLAIGLVYTGFGLWFRRQQRQRGLRP